MGRLGKYNNKTPFDTLYKLDTIITRCYFLNMIVIFFGKILEISKQFFYKFLIKAQQK